MAGIIERNISNLHDQDTGVLVGYRNPVTGREDLLAPSYAWASLPSAASLPVGTELLVSDVGNTSPERWRTDGSSWRLVTPTDITVDFTPVTGVANTSEQILKQYTFQAGVLRAFRYFAIKVLYAKSSTSETATIRARLGTAGTTSDTAILTNSSTLVSTNRAAAVEGSFFASSATQVRGVGRDSSFGVGGFTAGASTTSYPTNFTTPNMDSSALILSLSLTMSGGVETGTVAHVIITGY